MAHQLTLSLKRKQNLHGILMKVKRDDSLSCRHTLYLKKQKKTNVCWCSSNKTSMSLNLKQLEYVVLVEDILYHKKSWNPHENILRLNWQTCCFILRVGDYILGNVCTALWECVCLAGKIKAEAWKEDMKIFLAAKYIE